MNMIRTTIAAIVVSVVCSICGPRALAQAQNGTLEVSVMQNGCTLDGTGFDIDPVARNVYYWRRPTWGTSDYFNACDNYLGAVWGIPYNNLAGEGLNEDQPDGAWLVPQTLNAGYLGMFANSECRTVNGIQVCNEYREYATNELASSLVPNNYYEIRFRLSAAQGGDSSIFENAQWNPHAWKNVGIVLSANPLMEYHYGVLQAAAGANVQREVATSPTFWYNPIYPRWVDVSALVYITGNAKNYVTIGNIDPYLDNTNSMPIAAFGQTTTPGVRKIYSYYFLDGLEVEAVEPPTTCTDCSRFSVKATKKVPSPAGQCCYLIEIKNSSTCPIATVELDPVSQGEDQTLDLGGSPIMPNTTRIVEACVSAFAVGNSTLGSENVTWNVRLRGVGNTLMCTKQIRVACDCECVNLDILHEPPRDGVTATLVRDTTSENECCYVVRFTNARQCDFRSLVAFLDLDFSAPAAGLSVSALGPFDTPIVTSNGFGQITDVKSEATSVVNIPANGSLDVLRVCLDAGAPDVDMTVSWGTSTPPDFYWFCSRTFDLHLSCDLVPLSCCDNITITTRGPRWSDPLPYPATCCIFLEASQIPTPGCDIYSVTLVRPDNSERTMLGGNGKPLTIAAPPAKTPLTMLCGGEDCPCTYTIRFKDKFGNVICEKTHTRPYCNNPLNDPYDPSPVGFEPSFGKAGGPPVPETAGGIRPRAAALYDMQGKQVLTFPDPDDADGIRSLIRMSSLANGAYMLRVERVDGTVTTTLVTR